MSKCRGDFWTGGRRGGVWDWAGGVGFWRGCGRWLALLCLGLMLVGSVTADISDGTATQRERNRERDRERDRERGRGREREEPLVSQAPLPREVRGQVQVGDRVNLLLEAFGAGLAQLRFDVVTPPTQGQVVAIDSVADQPNAALLVFEATPGSAAGDVEFFFQAQRRSGGPTSGPVRAVVRIVPAPERLMLPPPLQFGEVAVGDQGEVVLELENASRLPLTVQVDLTGLELSWGDGESAVRTVDLQGTAIVRLPLVWQPTATGPMSLRLPVNSPQATAEVLVRGQAVPPVEVRPTQLDWVLPGLAAAGEAELAGSAVGAGELAAALWQGTASGEVREGGAGAAPADVGQGELKTFRVLNHTNEPLEALVEGGEVLGLPPRVTLPARGDLEMLPKFSLEGGRGGEGKVLIRTRRGELVLPWRVPSVPAVAELELASGGEVPELLDFGVLALGQERSVPLVMRNLGGEVGFVLAETKSPFVVAYDSGQYELAPGVELALELGVRGDALGVKEGVFDFGFRERRKAMRLRVEVVEPEELARRQGEGGAQAPEDAVSRVGSVEDGTAGAGRAGIDLSGSSGLAAPGLVPTGMRGDQLRPADVEALSGAPGSEERQAALQRILFAPRAPRHVEFPIILRFDETKVDGVTMSWPLPRHGGFNDLIWELSWLGTGRDRQWQKIDAAVTVDTQGHRAQVTLSKLRKGADFPLRITGRRPGDGAIMADNSWRISLPKPVPWWVLLWRFGRWVVLAGGLGFLGWYGWRQWQARGGGLPWNQGL